MLSVKESKRDSNGTPYSETLIGQVHVTEAFERRIGYETASWYTLVDVQPGTYDIVLYQQFSTKWVLVRYRGIVTREHFVNRVFTASSVHEPTDRIGREIPCTAQMQTYSAAEKFATDPSWTLADDWKLTEREYESSAGGMRTLYGIEESC